MQEHAYAQYQPATLVVSAFPYNARQNSSRYVSETYQRDADSVWKTQPSQVTKAQYAALSKDMLDGLWVMTITSKFPLTISTAKLEGVSMTKRAEPLFGAAYFTE